MVQKISIYKSNQCIYLTFLLFFNFYLLDTSIDIFYVYLIFLPSFKKVFLYYSMSCIENANLFNKAQYILYLKKFIEIYHF